MASLSGVVVVAVVLMMMATLEAGAAETYGTAIAVAVREAVRRGLHRAAAHVCWGHVAERRLVAALSSSGVAVRLLRGREHTTAAAVEALLREGSGRSAVLVDMACPAAHRLLVMASRLRLFDIANTWLVLEDGRLVPTWDADTDSTTILKEPGTAGDAVEFPDADLVPTGRYGGQHREDALLPNETVLLEVAPPPRSPSDNETRIDSQPSLLSPWARRVLEPLVVLSDSEVLWVRAAPECLQGLIVFRTSMAWDWQVYLAANGSGDGDDLDWAWLLTPEQEKAIQGRRGDLQGATLRSPIIINFPQIYTHIEDLHERKRDYRPKTNFPVVKNMAEQANVNLLVFERDDYGYNKDANGMFDGLMGELQRFECDLLSTAVYVTNERLYILDSVAETFPLRTGVIYKMSSSRSASNIYLEPFSEGVWLAVAAIMAVCTAELVATTRSWATHKPVLISVADCVTAVLGVLCQQGADRTPDSVSGRTVMTMLLLTSFFIFTSFGAFIVALLQAPATPLGSPKELLASPLKISAMDVAFIHAWFRGEVAKPVRGVVGDIFVKKIKKHERPGFLPVWEGIELVRRRGYGYQAEMNEAYHEIQEKFTETEKCDLFEMELFPSEAQIIVTVEKSPYREVFSRFVRWQRELGLLDRISKRWYASKPRCESGSRGFQAIGAREVVPLLLLLTYGVLLSLLLLAMEIMSRHRRPRAPPACSPSYWRRPSVASVTCHGQAAAGGEGSPPPLRSAPPPGAASWPPPPRSRTRQRRRGRAARGPPRRGQDAAGRRATTTRVRHRRRQDADDAAGQDEGRPQDQHGVRGERQAAPRALRLHHAGPLEPGAAGRGVAAGGARVRGHGGQLQGALEEPAGEPVPAPAPAAAAGRPGPAAQEALLPRRAHGLRGALHQDQAAGRQRQQRHAGRGLRPPGLHGRGEAGGGRRAAARQLGRRRLLRLHGRGHDGAEQPGLLLGRPRRRPRRAAGAGRLAVDDDDDGDGGGVGEEAEARPDGGVRRGGGPQLPQEPAPGHVAHVLAPKELVQDGGAVGHRQDRVRVAVRQRGGGPARHGAAAGLAERGVVTASACGAAPRHRAPTTARPLLV